MMYYNIHTHRPSRSSDETAIVNYLIKEKGDIREEGSSPFQSIGIHPWYIYNVREQSDTLREAILRPGVVAIGEAGFDKLAEASLELQREVFLLQARLAEEVSKPLIIHCVKAWNELIEAKKEVNPQSPWIIHGFRGNEVLADQLLKQGFYLSFGEYYNPEALQKAWPERLFIETDDKERDIRNVYQQIRTSLRVEPEVFASQMRKNVHKIFSV